MISTTIRKGSRPYFDDIHFPRGFSRSGEFTVVESMLMNDFGYTLKCLHDGVLMPENVEEKRFIDVVTGTQEPQSQIEKTWMKYLRASMPKTFLMLTGSSRGSSGFESSEYELEL